MTMDAGTEVALRESIAHWERLALGTYRPNEWITSSYCALCTMFLDDSCQGCPVAQETGAELCDESPYSVAQATANSMGLDSPEFRAAAQVELDFLRSLLPP